MGQLERPLAIVAGVAEMIEFDWDPRLPLKVICPLTNADFVTHDRFRLDELRPPLSTACQRCEAIHELDLTGVISEERVGDLVVLAIRRADGTIFRTPNLRQRPAERP